MKKKKPAFDISKIASIQATLALGEIELLNLETKDIKVSKHFLP